MVMVTGLLISIAGLRRMRVSIAFMLMAVSVQGYGQDTGGQSLFQMHCAACHLNPIEDDIPSLEAMSMLAPNDVLASLASGNMRMQGKIGRAHV